MAVSELPPGFVLDQPADTGLPPGFVMDKIGLGEDLAKSGASGLASATAGTLGAVGDIRSGLSAATDYAGSKLGVSPDTVQRFKDIMSRTPTGALASIAPTSKQVLEAAPNPIVSPDYKPQTVGGDLLKTGAEFLPSLIGGPEGLGVKLLTRVAGPTAASVTAGQLTKGTEAEPYARLGGAVLGAAGASKAVNAFNEARALKAATPVLKDLKSDTSAGYDALTSGNVATPLAVGTLDTVAADIRDTLNRKGMRPTNAGSIHSAVDELRTPATAGAPDVADLVASRQSIKSLLGVPDTNKAGSAVALQKIEAAIEQASPGTMQELKSLDKNWGAVRSVEALDKKVARADLRAAGADSGMNVGNKIRQKVADLLLSNEAKYLSAETKGELEKVVRGTWTQNSMRLVSNMLGGGGGLGSTLLGLGGAAAGTYSGHPELSLLPVAGMGVRGLTNRSVSGQAQRAADKILRQSPAGQKVPLLMPPPSSASLAALRAALLARPNQ